MGTLSGRRTPSGVGQTAPHQGGWGASLGHRRGQAIWLLAICLALIVTRWALLPRYLITFDEINFALAVDRFDPRIAQPQAPGYPVFVALLKLVSLVVPRIEMVFLIAGLIVSAASLFVLLRLGERIIGPNDGIIAALLLLFNPAFWLAALTNPVRLCFAAGAIAVALCVWLACERVSVRWFLIAAAALGLSAGARPALALVMGPLILWAAWRMRAGRKVVALALLCFCAAVGVWLPALVVASGGPQQFLTLLQSYSDQQMGGTSLLFGAPLHNALQMAWEAIAWSCLGALSWLWAVPLLKRKNGLHPDRFTTQFLAVWFFPGLLFYAIFHVGDPDHTLAIVPATCAAGAIVLAGLTRHASRSKRALLISTCVFLNIVLFFKPISVTTKPSTYKSVQWMSDYIAGVIEGVGALHVKRRVTVVFEENITGWRQVSYYEPDVHIIVLLHRNGSLTTRDITGKDVIERPSADGSVTLPACGVLAWVDPVVRPVAGNGLAVQTMRSRVFFTPAAPGQSFEYRGVHFVSSDKACGGTVNIPSSAGVRKAGP